MTLWFWRARNVLQSAMYTTNFNVLLLHRPCLQKGREMVCPAVRQLTAAKGENVPDPERANCCRAALNR
ncbi:MAG: hypothetical protein NWT12_05375 [Paracoccaceae bacterium]|nr:hypothetical protein [Paracoccaceae bacterium]